MNARLLAALRVPILVVAAALTAFFAMHAAGIGIERDNESLRSVDAEDQRVYGDFVRTFGSDEDVLVAVAHPRLLDAEGLDLVRHLTSRIEALGGVRRVWSLATVEVLVPGEAGAEPRPLLDVPGGVVAALDRTPEFTGWLVSGDRRTAGIVVEIEDRPDDAAYRGRLVDALRAMTPEVAQRGGEMHLTGVPVQKIDVSAAVDRDQRVLMPAAVATLGVVLALFFRHATGVLVPLAVAGLTVLWTVGLYVATGHALNAITSLLPPVLLVVALASTVHVYDAWQRGHGPADASDAQEPGAPGEARLERAARAVAAVFVPALLCAVTTAQGFASLAVGGLPAVRQFGLFAAFGTVAAFVVATAVVPAALSFAAPPRHRASDAHSRTLRFLDATSALATSRPWAVLAVFAVLTAAALAGIPRLRVDTDLVGFLGDDAPLPRDTAWIDENLGGTLPMEFVVRRTDGRPFATAGDVRRLDTLERDVLARDGVAGVTSVLDVLRQVERAERGPAGGTQAELPADDAAAQRDFDLLDESGHPLVRRYAAEGMRSLRLTVRLRRVGSSVSSPLVRSVQQAATGILGPGYALTPTGSLWQVVRDSDDLVWRQVGSFGGAVVLVVAAIGLLLRSVAFTAVAMIPNVVPVVWTGGLMGWGGIELSTGTAMIASAVLGLVVDDTIHYLVRYRREHEARVAAQSAARREAAAVEAVRATSRAVGAPVTVASTSLVLGFWVGALGSFVPTVWFSLLTGLTMITGVVCDLLVLPSCLVLLERWRGSRVAGGGPGLPRRRA